LQENDGAPRSATSVVQGHAEMLDKVALLVGFSGQEQAPHYRDIALAWLDSTPARG